MQNPDAELPTLSGTDPPATTEASWFEELETLLLHAAELSARHGVPKETFMAAAWSAFLAARPGLREELEERELKSQLKKLRKQGLLAQA